MDYIDSCKERTVVFVAERKEISKSKYNHIIIIHKIAANEKIQYTKTIMEK